MIRERTLMELITNRHRQDHLVTVAMAIVGWTSLRYGNVQKDCISRVFVDLIRDQESFEREGLLELALAWERLGMWSARGSLDIEDETLTQNDKGTGIDEDKDIDSCKEAEMLRVTTEGMEIADRLLKIVEELEMLM
jgi:hypothetical protein